MAGAPTREEPEGNSVAIRNAKVFPSSDRRPIEHGTVLVRDGRIAAVGPDVPIPPGTRVIEGAGRAVTAGFWNAHVHFTVPKWKVAAK